MEPRRPLTREEMYGKNGQIQRLCYTTKPDGAVGMVNRTYINHIFNPNKTKVPGLSLARKIADALTEILGREVIMDDVYDYLVNVLGKDINYNITRSEGSTVKEQVWEFFETHPGRYLVSDVVDGLGVSTTSVRKALRDLREEGKLARGTWQNYATWRKA